MFERLIDLVIQLWGQLTLCQIINQYECGVVLRFGIFKRYAKPGLRFKIPFVENILTTNTVVTTTQLYAQTLTTKDNQSVVVSAVIKYQIHDVKPFLLEIYDSSDVLNDVVQGAIKLVISETDCSNINDVEIEKKVLQKSRNEVKKYGFKIERITFIDIGRIRSIRLLSDSASPSAHE